MRKLCCILICCLLVASVAAVASAKPANKSKASPKALYAMRGQLKKYALSSCIISQSNDRTINGIVGLGAGGYFELSFHGDEEAYKAVREYGAKLSCPKNIVECCLDALEREEFATLLKAQDKYARIPDEKELRDDQW